MNLSAAVLDVLECVLVTRATGGRRGHSSAPHDGLTVRVDGKRGEEKEQTDISVTACGVWTNRLSCQQIIDCCRSLSAILCQPSPGPANEGSTSHPMARMKYVSVTPSGKETYAVEVKGDGQLEASLVQRKPAEAGTQPNVSITLQCVEPISLIRQCCLDVRTFLFSYKMVHPKVILELSTNMAECADCEFRGGSHNWSKVCSGVKMITDPAYFLQCEGVEGAPSCHRSLRPASEGSLIFLSPSLRRGESPFSLRCAALSALVPPLPPPPPGETRPAATQHTAPRPSQLWLSVYGPGSLPLRHPGWRPLETVLNLEQLVNWEALGFTPASTDSGAGPCSLLNQPIRECFVPDMMRALHAGGHTRETDSVILVMLFFIENSKGRGTTPEARLALLNRVRQEFPRICAQQFSGIRKIIHDTLSKLLGTRQNVKKDRKAVLKAAVPACTTALCDIISRSTNDVFRRRCLSAVQATSRKELAEGLTSRLAAMCDRAQGQSSSSSLEQVDPCSEGDMRPARSDVDASTPHLSSHHPQQEQLASCRSQEENMEDADFDLLDDTSQLCLTSTRADSPCLHDMTSHHPTHLSPPASSTTPSSMLSASSSSSLLCGAIGESLPLPSPARPPVGKAKRPTHVHQARSLSQPGSSSQLHYDHREQRPYQDRAPSGAYHVAPAGDCEVDPGGARGVDSRRISAVGQARSQPCSSQPLHESSTDRDPSGARGLDPAGARCTTGAKVTAEDLHIFQETLEGELGNDWFESLMDHDDWMTNEM